MKFLVRKTSAFYCDETAPCEGAKGWIVRDIESEGWAIDIETIDDLMAFVDKNGDIVIQKDDAEDFPWLEIYDTYRE